jgi:hypothetical protein
MTSDKQPSENYHTYESNPVPWWIALLWAGYFLFSVTYLVVNIING